MRFYISNESTVKMSFGTYIGYVPIVFGIKKYINNLYGNELSLQHPNGSTDNSNKYS